MGRKTMKLDLGKLYYVEFWDHALHTEPLKCCICGWPTSETDISVTFTTWLVLTDDYGIEENNREYVSILKSCIVKKRKLPI